MANTIIQIKRSTSTAAPTSLQYGELAYSFQSGRFYIGNTANVPIAIGGNTYNQMVDAATSANSSGTIVERDTSGSFAANIITATLAGNATTASAWQTARLIGVSGDATGQVSVNGSADANVPLTLSNTGVVAGTYGGGANLAIVQIDSKGRVTYAANTELVIPSNSFTINGDTGSDTFSTGQTLTFEGANGINTIVTDNKVSINAGPTLVRTTGNQTITGNLSITGDLIVGGNTTSIDVSTLTVEDSLIRLANNNTTSDTLDIGFYGAANPGTLGYYGFARVVADSGNFFAFKGLPANPTGNTIPAASVTYANTATIRASLTGGIVSGLNAAIGVTDGGTGLKAVANGDILFANNTNSLTSLAKAATGNVLLSGNAPSWGKVGLTTHVSGTLPTANGGTNATTIGTAGSIAFSNGTSYVFNTAGSSGQALISGGTGTPTFGVLGLTGGGLGFSTITANTVVFANATNTLTATNSASDGQVLQFTTAGGVLFGMLDGGSF